jgi:metal-dependent amidase/aminoacylase/carboxypeptidase family protein
MLPAEKVCVEEPQVFPTRWQTVIFRNYGYVSVDKIAEVLGCDEETVRFEAARLGLGDAAYSSLWEKKGYITLIRNNWFLLPYAQLLTLLAVSEEELEFIKKMQPALNQAQISNFQKVFNDPGKSIHSKVGDRNIGEKISMTASSDVGDISQIIPTNFFTVATWPFGCVAHLWQVTVFSGHTIGEKGALYAAKVMAGTAYDLLTDPAKVSAVKAAFEATKDTNYEPMVK